MSLLTLLLQESNPNESSCIQHHLHVMLNTRMESVPYAMDYGMPDLNDIYMDMPQSARQLQHQLHQLIQCYEPRLLGTEVISIPIGYSEAVIRFKIKSHINRQTRRHWLANCLATGHCHIEPCHE